MISFVNPQLCEIYLATFQRNSRLAMRTASLLF
jgi:hypothetical protein